jgi:hypothetical protein
MQTIAPLAARRCLRPFESKALSATAQEPYPSSREFVKQSNVYQEFLAEREKILKHKWLEASWSRERGNGDKGEILGQDRPEGLSDLNQGRSQ